MARMIAAKIPRIRRCAARARIGSMVPQLGLLDVGIGVEPATRQWANPVFLPEATAFGGQALEAELQKTTGCGAPVVSPIT
jgi:hypothetical protein